MKVLVIGGTGTISEGIAFEAVNCGYDVTIVNRGNQNFRSPQGVTVIKCDINNRKEFKSVIQNNYDIIVDPLTFGVIKLKRMIKLISGHCKRYIFISSTAVFGSNDAVIDENTEKRPIWEYGKNKLCCEEYLRKRHLKFEYTIIRPSVTYGDIRIPIPFSCRKNPYTVIDRIINNRPLVCFDLKNEKTRKLMDIRDFSKYAVATFDLKASGNNDYIICSDEEYTWDKAYTYLFDLLGKKKNIYEIDKSLFQYTGDSLYFDIIYDKSANTLCNKSKIKRDTGIQIQETDLKTGISRIIEYLQNNYKERSIEEQYNIMSDCLLLYAVDNKDDKLNSYLDSLDEKYKKELELFWNAKSKEVRNNNSFIRKKIREIKNGIKYFVYRSI